MGVAHVGLVHCDPASARLKAFVRFPPLKGMYQIGGTCKGCDILPAKGKRGVESESE